MPQEIVARSSNGLASQGGKYDVFPRLPGEVAFLYEPRRLWTFSTGINEYSREGASRAHAVAKSKALSGGVSEVCFSSGEVEFG